ncbi:hypothetical protein ACR9WD_06050 [Glutamicibacter sp. PAEs-4]|uniref:hypothetical protein n=1 Tax=Glutamicibacter sp. PAEs-4 TaxID=3444114 RepID=UPI003EBE17BD
MAERRALIGNLDGLSVEIMEYAEAVSLMRSPEHRSLYTNPSQEAIDYRIKAYGKNYEVRAALGTLNGNCNSLARKHSLTTLRKAETLQDAILETCAAMFDVNLLARTFPRGLPYVDPFHSKEVIKRLDIVVERIRATESARKDLLENFGNSYRKPHFMNNWQD